MSKRYEHYIGGRWRQPSKGTYLESHNPFDGTLNAEFAEGDESDVDAAVAAAAEAFASGSWDHPQERARVLRRVADLVEENLDWLAGVESRDNGKIIREERAAFSGVSGFFRYAASLAETVTGETPRGRNAAVLSLTEREPYGVVGVQTPWNTPVGLFSQAAATALAAGNTVVSKPSELAPCSILEFAAIIEEAGFPAGVLNVVTGLGPVVGAALSSHRSVNKLAFTGSPEAGRMVAAQAAANLIPVTMELGGKSANIVFADADVEAASRAAAQGFTAAGGQTCVAGSRILVQRGVYDEVLERIVEHVTKMKLGDPSDDNTDMGPMCGRAQLERIQGLVAQGVSEGARLVAGGVQSAEFAGSLFFPPTVFSDVTNDMVIAREEVFGPVGCVLPFGDESEAIAIANDSPYGLGAGVWTTNLNRAHRVSRALRAGMVWVNDYRSGDPSFPFGGYGESGYGRFGGLEGYREMTRVKSIRMLLGD